MEEQRIVPSVAEESGNITLSSTSRITAEATPVILSQTERIRVLFEPVIIDNPHDPQKCVKGKLVYEKKRANDKDFPTERASRISVHTDECMEISLDSSETLALFDGLGEYYRLYHSLGCVPAGDTSYARIDSEFGRLALLLQQNPQVSSYIKSQSTIDLIAQLMRTLVSVGSSDEIHDLLSRMEADGIDRIWGAANIEKLKRVESLLLQNKTNSREEFWQTIFEENQWILAQIFGSPVTVYESKAYVGGKCINNHGAQLCDFLFRNSLTKNVSLIEIKTPCTPLMGTAYRANIYPFSKEVSGAVSQILAYKDSLIKQFGTSYDPDRIIFNPSCVVVVGTLSSLTMPEVASFELCRSSLLGVQIVTYDEVTEKVRNLISIVTNTAIENATELGEDIPF